MRFHISTAARIFVLALLAIGLFAGGYVAGQNKFGQPKTIIHMVILKWRPGVADADKQRALEGVKEMAAKVPGVKNIWIKADRIQLIINTPHGPDPYFDEKAIRRAAVTARIPTITTLSAARAAAEGIAALQRGEVRVQALQALHAERMHSPRL